jgi:hypothetical protein
MDINTFYAKLVNRPPQYIFIYIEFAFAKKMQPISFALCAAVFKLEEFQ